MSTTTMQTSRGVKSSFWGLTPIAISPSRENPAARPETTALWYSALTSIFPSVAGVVMVLFHIVRVRESPQLGRLILDFGRRVNGADLRCARVLKACNRKSTTRKTILMINGVKVQFQHPVRHFLTMYFVRLLRCNGVWRRRGGKIVTSSYFVTLLLSKQDIISSISSSQSILQTAIASRRTCLK